MITQVKVTRVGRDLFRIDFLNEMGEIERTKKELVYEDDELRIHVPRPNNRPQQVFEIKL